jgi:hypothetical protein
VFEFSGGLQRHHQILMGTWTALRRHPSVDPYFDF